MAVLVAASAAAPPAANERPGVVTAAKIDPGLRERAQAEAVVPVFVVLAHQPQYEMMRQAEGNSALRRQVAESRYRALVQRSVPNAEELGEAREATDAVVLQTRREAFQAIERAVGPEQDALEGRLRQLGATAISRYMGINMLAAEIPASALAALESDPAIAHVFAAEKDVPQLATSVPALGAPAFWNAGYTGQGESVGILDTGVRTNHPAFAGKPIVSQVFLTYGRTDSCFADNSSSAEDQEGHGTHAAGVVASQGSSGWTSYLGVAKGVGTLYNLKVAYKVSPLSSCGGGGRADRRDVVAALDWAVRNTPLKIFNYGWSNPIEGDRDGFTQSIDQYIDNYGLTVTLAGGNAGPADNSVTSPADGYNSIAVANWVSRGVINDSSSRGHTWDGRPKPDLAAPGTGIVSASYNWDATPGTGDDFMSATGTSAAAAHIAGAAALFRSAGVQDPLAIKAILLNTTDNTGWQPDSGWGFTNLNRALEQLYYTTGSLTAGSLKLYRISGDPRATLVWNRHVSDGASYINTLGFRLYEADNGAYLGGSYSLAGVVEVFGTNSGGNFADSVVAVNIESSPLAGVSSEPFAVAFNGPWSEMAGPQISASCTMPSSVASGSQFSVPCTVTNSGDLPAVIGGTLSVPDGFSFPTWAGLYAPSGSVQPGSSVPASFWGVTAPTSPGTYTLYANASTSSFSTTPITQTTSFTLTVYPALSPPMLTSPANGATGVSVTPTLTWSAVGGATSYDVYLGTSTPPPFAGNTTGTSADASALIYIASALRPGTLYYWWVEAKNGAGTSSSATETFMTQGSKPGPQYLITTVAGAGPIPGTNQGTYGGDGGPATSAFFHQPEGVAEDPAGNLYIADTVNQRIRKVAPNGIVNTVAGTGLAGYSGDGGPATSAQFNGPSAIALDAAGSLYVADSTNSVIRKVMPDGTISTVAGQRNMGCEASAFGSNGDGGPAARAILCIPTGVAVAANGDYYIAEQDTNRVRKVTSSGIISTLSVGFVLPMGVAVDAGGNVYVADQESNALVMLSPTGAFSVLAQLGGPSTAVAADAADNVYVDSTGIVKVTPNGTVTKIAGGGSANNVFSGDGGIATDATFFPGYGLAVGAAGAIYAADIPSERVRVLMPFDPSCQYQLDRTSVAVSAARGTFPISIQTGPTCSWVISGLPSWLGAHTFGRGPGTATLTAVANPGALRAATISVAGYAVQVVQGEGVCGYALDSSGATVSAAGGVGTLNVTAGPSCPWTVSSPPGWITLAGPAVGVGNGSVSYTVAPNQGGARSATLTVAGLAFTLQQLDISASGLRFTPVTPCRVVDTRFAGPTMAAGEARSFAIWQSGCGIPSTAQAYSLNVTVVPQGPLSYLTLWPTGQAQPGVSTLNSFGGIVVANAAIVPAGVDGAVSVYVTDPTDVILDIDGYFDYAVGPGSFSFYPAQPCRVADTRGPAGPFGGSSLTSGEGRDFPVPSSSCGLPSTASAYSMNVTVVPAGYLGYLKTWPTGQAQPNVSTLNSWTGKVVANAALVPAGTGGSISVYVQDPTAVILDTNGYFGAPGLAGALSFYPVTPCRVADTRGDAGPLGGPEMEAGTTRSFPIPSSDCGIPATTAAYSLNVTVVPDGPLSFLTAWPMGSVQPMVSTLNSFDGAVVANAAILPAGAGGAINVYVTDRTQVILDINGYFAP